MPYEAVVIGLDIFKAFSLSLISCQKGLLIHKFSLEIAKERLSHRIVPTVTFTAHTLNETILLNNIPEAVTSILHPTVRMDDQPGGKSAPEDRTVKSLHDHFMTQGALVAQPTTQRENRSIKTVKYSQPSRVQT